MKRALVATLALAVGCAPGERGASEAERIAALERERDRLRGRLAQLAAGDALRRQAPAGDVLLGVPTSLARSLVAKVMTGLVDGVTLVLHDIHVRKQATVKKVVTLGSYELDVTIDEVRATLKTGTPELAFGGNRIDVKLPVRLDRGAGRARVRFRWDGRNVAGMVCGDMDVTRDVSGNVRPATYPVRGALLLSAEATEIVATPRFPELKVKLVVEPSAASWAAVEQLLDEKTGTCGYVLEKADVKGRIQEVVGRGFVVRLPTERLKPVRLPAAVRRSVAVADRSLALDVKLGGLGITPEMLWLGAVTEVDRGAGPLDHGPGTGRAFTTKYWVSPKQLVGTPTCCS
jgi:hypothetical protein